MRPAHPTQYNGSRFRERLVALTLGVLMLTLYVRTLLPHIGGTEDTPKFQYLGSVLGTAHSPGYPLYVIVSYAFSWLPIGTLAYRMNLMSACFAALTVILAFFVARRLRTHQVVSATIAVALGTGPAFWSNAGIAEVYTLNTVLWTAAVLKLVDWRLEGRDRDLYLATMFVALGVGHHLTIVAFVPAAFACLLLSKRPWFRLRTVHTCAAILTCGLAQYTYIWIRTLQGSSPYLEVKATSLAELIPIITARNWAPAMFGVETDSLVRQRVPEMLKLLIREMGWVGVASAGIGMGALLASDVALAALLGLSGFTVWFLTANYTLADLGGFLLPAYASLWLLAAVGIERVRVFAGARMGRAAAGVTVILGMAFAASQVVGNYPIGNRRHQVTESRFFAAMFEQLPPSAAVIIEEYTPEQMLLYGVVSGDFHREGAPLRLMTSDPGGVRQELERGTPVYAMPRPAASLRGMGFSTEPVRLLGTSLVEYLENVDDSQLVAVAATVKMLPNEFTRRFQGTIVRLPGAARMLALGVMTSRGESGAIEEIAEDRLWPAGEIVPGTHLRLTETVRAGVTEGMPVVWIGSRQIVSRDGDVLVVVLDHDGRLESAREFSASTAFRDFLPPSGWDLARVTHAGACLEIGGGDWHDIMSISGGAGLRGRLDNYRPFDASMTVYLASEWPVSPKLGEFSSGCQARSCAPVSEPSISVKSYRLDTPQDRHRLQRDVRADGLDVQWPAGTAHVTRADVTANDQGQFVSWWLAFGGVPSTVLARTRTDDPSVRRGVACAAPPVALFADSESRWEFAPSDDSVIDFGSGWHRPESLVRWTADPTAVLLVPLARSGRVRVQVEGYGSAIDGGTTLRLRVNGHETEARTLDAQLRSYEWTVPASAWRSGLNHLALLTAGAVDEGAAVYRGVAVRRILFDLIE